ncbi:MAG: hypothetical protein HPY71_12095 [Firmicutes bacterium]|nr:hypothetical protein [Bacillota bacterium]
MAWTSKDRVAAVLNFEIPDRIPKQDLYWPETIQRWTEEGLPRNLGALGVDLPAYFDEESPINSWLSDYFGHDMRQIGLDNTLQLPEELLDETDNYIVKRNADGMTVKHFKEASGPPQMIDVLVKTREDWNEYKSRLAYSRNRLKVDPETYHRWRKHGLFIYARTNEPYVHTWHFHGVENTLMDMVNDPGLVRDMFQTSADLTIAMVQDLFSSGYPVDALVLGGDMCYRNGPLFSPQFYEELLLPFDRMICNACRDLGIPVILHTDGDCRSLIPLYIKAGFRGLHPLEAKAGMDLRELKKIYNGRLVLFGNIDVRALGGTKEDVRTEMLSKITAGKEGGGYIYHSDNSVPPSVSYDNYLLAMSLLEEHGIYY